MNVLEIDDLRVRYGDVEAVRGIDLRVAAGEVFGLLGPNGAGKTTTLSVIEGLCPPAGGRVTVGGIDVARWPRQARARTGAQLQTTSFQSELSLLELLQLYAALYGVHLNKAQARSTLAEFDLSNVATRRVGTLSGGQRQRFALAVTLVHEPDLVLLDEPTAGLDPQSRRSLWGRIEALREKQRAVVLTTHSMEEAAALCDRIGILDHGRLVACGTPDELVARGRDDETIHALARGPVTLEDVFIGLTGPRGDA